MTAAFRQPVDPKDFPMRVLKTSLLLLSLSAVLSGCGGGAEADDEDTGPVLGAQQYPGGVWAVSYTPLTLPTILPV